MSPRNKVRLLIGTIAIAALAGAGSAGEPGSAELRDPRERHLTNVRQLTFGGQNAEAYFSPDGRQLIFQSTRDGTPCDQIYVMRADGTQARKVSTGQGRTTCAYFFPGGERFLYASTHHVSSGCLSNPDHSKGYVWALHPYDIFVDKLGGGELRRLTNEPGYDAEATISPDGKSVVFTSDRDGDLELYTMDLEGRRQKRLTRTPGYDGGAFYSPDSRQIVYRAHHPAAPADLAEYRSLLSERLVRPAHMELRVMNADGTEDRQVTRNGKANFAPYFHPDGKRIVFSSNMLDRKGRDFDLFMVGTDGRGLQRVTYSPTFDAFPIFSPDGKKLVFASNRNGRVPHETNVFLADWVE